MVDSADPGFYGAAWRFTDFRQQLSAGSVYLQFVLKACELPGKFRGRSCVSCSENFQKVNPADSAQNRQPSRWDRRDRIRRDRERS